MYDRLKLIFEYTAGNESPPQAPRHASKPKAPKAARPAVPRWNSKTQPPVEKPVRPAKPEVQPAPIPEEYDGGGDIVMGGEEDTPDNLTVASQPYMIDEDGFEISQVSTGHRKRKREEQMQEVQDQQHAVYGDQLLDYFLLSRHNDQPVVRPEPPANFQPNWPIDAENHTALHWASAMGDLDVIKQLKRFNADAGMRNIRGETPLMRSVNFTNCYEKHTFPDVFKQLMDTWDLRDVSGCTVIHHAAIMKNSKHIVGSCSRYYLENILNSLQESLEPAAFQHLIDAQDHEGNTALHLAARRNARKCVRALLGRHASTTIENHEGVRPEDLIIDMNSSRKDRAAHPQSSSPFAPDSQRHAHFKDAFAEKPAKKPPVTFKSSAAFTVSTRITPIILEKFQELAKSYDEEWLEKDAAETEAKHILANTQAELNSLYQQIADVEAQLDPEEIASKYFNEANLSKHQVHSLITHQNRLHVQEAVEQEMAAQTQREATPADSYADRLSLAQQLSHMLTDQRLAESEYVEALSMVGTGEKIEKYRKLLKRCLDSQDGEILDTNLDSLIEMMEEEKDMVDIDGASPAEGAPPRDLKLAA